MNPTTRIEKDFLGTVEIPAGSLYGINTQRAVENFAISGNALGDEPAFVRAFALIKQACAAANREFDFLSGAQAEALAQAAEEAASGELNAHFIVDLLEGAGGTSLNMNCNEVLANRALAIMGHHPGEYRHLHPNDHVNRSQSTNDVVPSAINLACHGMLRDLTDALSELQAALLEKAGQSDDILRLGRTCLQDAQPMTLGQALAGYATLAGRCGREIVARRDALTVLPLGGTAIGTGLGAPRGFRERALAHLAALTGVSWQPPQDAFDAMQNADGYARLSSELKTCAVSLGKVASDLILLNSGPAGGVGELHLPPLQPGSSIMPGKVNPVQPMAIVQMACAVAGNDVTVAMACQQGQLEINAYEPVIASRLFDSIRILSNGIRLFSRRCISGIEPDVERMRGNLMRSSAVATALVPGLGYDRVSALVRQAQHQGRPFIDVAEEAGRLDRQQLMALIASTVNGASPEDD